MPEINIALDLFGLIIMLIIFSSCLGERVKNDIRSNGFLFLMVVPKRFPYILRYTRITMKPMNGNRLEISLKEKLPLTAIPACRSDGAEEARSIRRAGYPQRRIITLLWVAR